MIWILLAVAYGFFAGTVYTGLCYDERDCSPGRAVLLGLLWPLVCGYGFYIWWTERR